MKPRLAADRRLLLLTLAAGLPGTVVAVGLLLTSPASSPLRWGGSAALVTVWLALSFAAWGQFVRPVQTLSNLLAALRLGDFSVRARGARPGDPLGLALLEVNQLAERLRLQRLGGVEAGALLRAVLAEIDVAILAFDETDRVQFVNRAAADLLRRGTEDLLGRTAAEVEVEDLLRIGAPATIDRTFLGGSGRWDLRRGTFRQDGRPHRLVVLSNVSRALRQEEREAWQRLVRVLSHEINNSLAPIRSIAGSLLDLLRSAPPPADREEDLKQGLSVIAARSAALSRFMTSYARLTRLPAPQREPVRVREWVRRVGQLETRLPVALREGPPVTISADSDQLDQLLINLIRNGVEAARETGGAVEVGWETEGGWLVVRVLDEGPGLPPTANLFVPFFTTKPNGSGIGLALSRQIAEGHGGTVELTNRMDRRGCEARLLLPLDGAPRIEPS